MEKRPKVWTDNSYIYLKWGKGCLAGWVGGVGGSRSPGCGFQPHVGHRDYFKKKKRRGEVIRDGKYERKVKDTEERFGRYNTSLIWVLEEAHKQTWRKKFF